MRFKWLAAIVGLTLSGCQGVDEADVGAERALVVSIAASLTSVMEPLTASYRRSGGALVELNFAASSVLAAQIVNGAPVDLFISADRFQMERVVAAGRVADPGPVDLLSNRLAFVAPAGSTLAVAAPADLLEVAAARIAIADPSAVPAGVYARAYLKTEGLWNLLAPRLFPTQNVRAALATVEAGDADVGIVYDTDARSTSRVTTLFVVPASRGPQITYPAAVLTDSAMGADARRFLDYLSGEAGRLVFEAAGFGLAERH